jgi:hypothetical protein
MQLNTNRVLSLTDFLLGQVRVEVEEVVAVIMGDLVAKDRLEIMVLVEILGRGIQGQETMDHAVMGHLVQRVVIAEIVVPLHAAMFLDLREFRLEVIALVLKVLPLELEKGERSTPPPVGAAETPTSEGRRRPVGAGRPSFSKPGMAPRGKEEGRKRF